MVKDALQYTAQSITHKVSFKGIQKNDNELKKVIRLRAEMDGKWLRNGFESRQLKQLLERDVDDDGDGLDSLLFMMVPGILFRSISKQKRKGGQK